MGTNKIPTVARKAIEWLRKMNIEVKPVIGFDDMYIFKYNDVFMFIRTDTKPKELFLGAPVFLLGETNAENKAIFEIAEDMTKDILEDYIVQYVYEQLSYIGQIYVRPKHVPTLRLYQFLYMLNEIVDVHNTFLRATIEAVTSWKDNMQDDCDSEISKLKIPACSIQVLDFGTAPKK